MAKGASSLWNPFFILLNELRNFAGVTLQLFFYLFWYIYLIKTAKTKT